MVEENDTVSRYAEMVPGDIQRALEGLSSDRRMAILVLLIKEDGMPFSKIESELDLHQQKVSTALGRLQDSGIVIREDVASDENYRTEYKASKFGKRILDSLFDAIEPSETEDAKPFVIRNFESQQAPSDYYRSIDTSDRTEGEKTTFDQAEELAAPRDAKAVTNALS